MMRDTRPDYPPEFDEPDFSDWDGSTLGDICQPFGITPAADCLRAIDKYGEEGGTVSVHFADGQRLYIPDDLGKLSEMGEDAPVAGWIVHGIAWDGTDWEYSEEVSIAAEVPAALQRFADALEEHRADVEDV